LICAASSVRISTTTPVGRVAHLQKRCTAITMPSLCCSNFSTLPDTGAFTSKARGCPSCAACADCENCLSAMRDCSSSWRVASSSCRALSSSFSRRRTFSRPSRSGWVRQNLLASVSLRLRSALAWSRAALARPRWPGPCYRACIAPMRATCSARVRSSSSAGKRAKMWPQRRHASPCRPV